MFEALAKKYFRLMGVLSSSGSIDSDGHCAIGELPGPFVQLCNIIDQKVSCHQSKSSPIWGKASCVSLKFKIELTCLVFLVGM